MKKLFLLLSAAIIIASTPQARNPVIRDQFTADPTARVFNGRMYIYPSHDILSPIDRLKEWFCTTDYRVFFSTNLTDWIDHDVTLIQDRASQVQPGSHSMWAPDCVYKDRKHYFYFPSTPQDEGRRGLNIGVAIVDSPGGPFTPEVEPIKGVGGINLCVLIDTDEEAYIYWPRREILVAKLKSNMKELASGPMQI